MRVQDVSPGKAPGKGTQVCLGSAPTSVQATERAPDQAGRGRTPCQVEAGTEHSSPPAVGQLRTKSDHSKTYLRPHCD